MSDAFWTVVLQLLYFWMAFAFGMLLLNTPAAVAIYYVVALLLPLMVWGTLFALFEWARDLIPWIDLQYSSLPIVTGEAFDGGSLGALEWVRFAFTVVLWIGIPMAAGMARLLRAELK